MGKAGLVASILAIVIGVVIVIPSVWFATLTAARIAECNTAIGQLGQGLSPEQVEHCRVVSSGQAYAMAGLAGGAILAIVGIVGSVVSLRNKSREQYVPVPQANSSSLAETSTKMFCRYCGKLRPVEGEFCAECGKSMKSATAETKKCIHCSASMSNDSEFCANCGRKF